MRKQSEERWRSLLSIFQAKRSAGQAQQAKRRNTASSAGQAQQAKRRSVSEAHSMLKACLDQHRAARPQDWLKATKAGLSQHSMHGMLCQAMPGIAVNDGKLAQQAGSNRASLANQPLCAWFAGWIVLVSEAHSLDFQARPACTACQASNVLAVCLDQQGNAQAWACLAATLLHLLCLTSSVFRFVSRQLI